MTSSKWRNVLGLQKTHWPAKILPIYRRRYTSHNALYGEGRIVSFKVRKFFDLLKFILFYFFREKKTFVLFFDHGPVFNVPGREVHTGDRDQLDLPLVPYKKGPLTRYFFFVILKFLFYISMQFRAGKYVVEKKIPKVSQLSHVQSFNYAVKRNSRDGARVYTSRRMLTTTCCTRNTKAFGALHNFFFRKSNRQVAIFINSCLSFVCPNKLLDYTHTHTESNEKKHTPTCVCVGSTQLAGPKEARTLLAQRQGSPLGLRKGSFTRGATRWSYGGGGTWVPPHPARFSFFVCASPRWRFIAF